MQPLRVKLRRNAITDFPRECPFFPNTFGAILLPVPVARQAVGAGGSAHRAVPTRRDAAYTNTALSAGVSGSWRAALP